MAIYCHTVLELGSPKGKCPQGSLAMTSCETRACSAEKSLGSLQASQPQKKRERGYVSEHVYPCVPAADRTFLPACYLCADILINILGASVTSISPPQFGGS